jgi:hypothetical protein
MRSWPRPRDLRERRAATALRPHLAPDSAQKQLSEGDAQPLMLRQALN